MGHSLLGICHPAGGQKLMEFRHHRRGVLDMHVLAAAGGRAACLEGPGEAHLFAAVLRDGGLVTRSHLLDLGEPLR